MTKDNRLELGPLMAEVSAADFSSHAGGHAFYCRARKTWAVGDVLFFHACGLPRLVPSPEADEVRRTFDDLQFEAMRLLYAAADRRYLKAKITPGGIDAPPRLLRQTIAALAERRKPRNANPKKQKAVTIPQAAEAVGLSPRQYARLEKTPNNAWGIVPMARETWRGFRVWFASEYTRAAIRQHKAGGRVRDRKPKTIASPDLIDNATRDESGRVTLHRDGKVRTQGKRNR